MTKVTFPVELSIKANPAGTWTFVLESVKGITRLRINASEKWKSGGEEFGPDGKRTGSVPRSACLLATAPFGALIGKIGGSTAGLSDGYVFPVGACCVIDVGEGSIPKTGPLFLTINDALEGLEDNDGSIKVQIENITGLGE